jgi:hypothetical protein
MQQALGQNGDTFCTEKSGDKSTAIAPAILQLKAGWISTRRNQAAIIIPVLRVPQPVEFHARPIQLSNENDISNDDSQPTEVLHLKANSAVIVFSCVKYRFEPTDIPFRIKVLATIPLGDSGVGRASRAMP